MSDHLLDLIEAVIKTSFVEGIELSTLLMATIERFIIERDYVKAGGDE